MGRSDGVMVCGGRVLRVYSGGRVKVVESDQYNLVAWVVSLMVTIALHCCHFYMSTSAMSVSTISLLPLLPRFIKTENLISIILNDLFTVFSPYC